MIQKTSRMKWLFAGVLAAGVTGYIPVIYNPPGPQVAFAQDRDNDRDGVAVRIDDLPRDVRRTVDRERDNHEIKRIVHVDKDRNEYWRAIFDTKGDDLAVLINRDGEVIRRTKVPDVSAGAGVGRDLDPNERSYDGRGTWIRLNQAPEAVRNTLDRERGNEQVKQIVRVTRGDETYYRAVIDDRRGDRLVVVNSRGKLLEEREIGEARLARGRFDADNDERRVRVRRDYYDEGERLDYDRLPGEVKTAIGREAGSDRVQEVTAYTGRGGNTIYRAVVGSGGGTRRIIRVDENGRVFPDRTVYEEGKDRMRFEELPGPVKTAVGSQVNEDKIERILRETRGNRTTYRVMVDEGPTLRFLTFDETGRLVDEEERRDRN